MAKLIEWFGLESILNDVNPLMLPITQGIQESQVHDD